MRLLPLLLLSLIPLRALSQTPTPTPTPFVVPTPAANRYFTASTASPLTARTSPSAAARVHSLLTFITFIDTAVTSSTSASLASDAPRTDLLTTCNVNDRQFRGDLALYFGVRGWPSPDDGCTSNVYGAGARDDVSVVGSDDDGFEREEVFELVRKRASDVGDVAERVARDVGRDWPDATRASDFVYNIRTQTCTHDYASFVKLGGDWYLASTITNADKDLTLADGERQYLYEYVRAKADGEMLPPAKMRLRELVDDPDAYNIDATTAFSNQSGSVPASGFGKVFAEDNLAVQQALMAGEHETQQASDATTPSNIAILALPLAMNLVPVALVADVNTIGMLFYTLLTDVLTTVPLAIKGVEVLSIGLQKETAVVTRVTGGQFVDDVEKAGEVWVAQCVATGNLRPTGIALLVVALVFLVGGVVAEFVAKEYMKKKRRRKGEVQDVEEGLEELQQNGTQGVQAAGLMMAGTTMRGATGPKLE